MGNTEYLLVVQHNGGIFKKPYGEEGSKYVFTSPDECDKHWQNIFIRVGAKTEEIEERIKQRECLNMEAFGEDTPLSQNLPIFKISESEGLLCIDSINGVNNVKDPDHLVAVFVANKNWHYCLQHTEDMVDLLYINGRVSERVSKVIYYSVGKFNCPRNIANMAKDIRTVLSIYDRYLDMRHIEHMPFIKR